MGDGRAEESSAAGEGGQAAMSLPPDAHRMHVRVFESSQREGSYVGKLYIWLNHFAVHLKLAQRCKLTILHFLKGARL